MPTERLPVIRPGLVLGKDCDDILNYNNKKKNKQLCFSERSIIRTQIVFCKVFLSTTEIHEGDVSICNNICFEECNLKGAKLTHLRL